MLGVIEIRFTQVRLMHAKEVNCCVSWQPKRRLHLIRVAVPLWSPFQDDCFSLAAPKSIVYQALCWICNKSAKKQSNSPYADNKWGEYEHHLHCLKRLHNSVFTSAVAKGDTVIITDINCTLLAQALHNIFAVKAAIIMLALTWLTCKLFCIQ